MHTLNSILRIRRDIMKLLIIHPHLSIIGGSERLTQILVYELEKKRKNIEILVLTGSRNKELFPETSKIRFKLFKEAPVKAKNLRIKKLIDAFLTLSEVMDDFCPDAVLTMIQEPIYLVLSKIVKPNIGTAIYIHFPFEEELTKDNVVEFIKMYRFPGFYEGFYKFVDLKIANSNYTAKVLYEKFGLESNVVYPAIPWDFFKEKPSLDRDPGPSIISVGRFVPHKRFTILLKLFKDRIKPLIPEARLTIVGIPDPRYADYYRKIVELADRIADVEVISRPLTPLEMAKLYRQSRVYVHLRIGEHFGMAPVEAMSQGTVPILPSKSGLAELLTHGVSGFKYEDDNELVTYILEVLKMPRDEYLKLKKNAYYKSLYFTPERFVNDILGYLNLVI